MTRMGSSKTTGEPTQPPVIGVQDKVQDGGEAACSTLRGVSQFHSKKWHRLKRMKPAALIPFLPLAAVMLRSRIYGKR